MLFRFMKNLLALLCLLLPAKAADRVALVIGNDAYRHADPLTAAVSDAQAISKALQSLQFDVIKSENADIESMLEAMEQLKRRASGAEAVVIYFAGHGIESNGTNYLIPVDAKLEREIQLKTQTLSLDDILAEIKSISVPARIVILDCCRNNPIQGRAWLASRSGGGGLAALEQDSLADATLVIYSASPGKPALDRLSEKEQHSPFAAALLAELPKPGVHSFEMFGRVEDTVIQSTDGRQAPRLFYNGSTQPFRNFHFSSAETAPAPIPEPTPVKPAISQPPPAPTPTNAAYPNPVIQMAPPANPAYPNPVIQMPPPADPAYPNGGRPQLQQLVLPASGYFTMNELFSSSPYAAYNDYSKKEILHRVQSALKSAGHYTSTPDGITGPGTQRALNAWQQATGIPLTGKLDSATLSALGLTGISQMSAPAPVQRPAPSRPTPTKPRPAADDFFRNS